MKLKYYKSPAALLLYTLLLAILGIAGSELTGHDEPRVAGIARSMTISGEYAVPRLNGRDFCEYPSLGYVPIAFMIRIFGANEFAAHAANVIYYILTVYLTYRIGRALAGERAGLVAGLMLATSAGAIGIFRVCIVDPALLFFVTLSLWGYAEEAFVKNAFRNRAVFFAGMALGFLTKGALGIAFPAAVAAADIVAGRRWKLLNIKNIAIGLLVFAVPIGIWFAALVAGGNRATWDEVIRQSLWRFTSDTADHSNPFYYYFGPAIYLTAPASLLVLFVMIRELYNSRAGAIARLANSPALFPALWFVVMVAALSMASAKRNIYLAPAYPAMALLGALAWIRMPGERVRAACIPMITVLALAAAAGDRLRLREREESDTYAPIFNNIQSRGGNKNNILLYHPTEGLDGAGVFHLGGDVARARDAAALAHSLQKSHRFVIAELRRNEAEPAPEFTKNGREAREISRATLRQQTVIVYELP